MDHITVRSTQAREVIDITSLVSERFRRAECSEGVCVLGARARGSFVLVIEDNEGEKDRMRDGDTVLGPGQGTSLTIPIVGGTLALDKERGIVVVEHNGPRTLDIACVVLCADPNTHVRDETSQHHRSGPRPRSFISRLRKVGGD